MMSNMNYCRFENTYRDLKDCVSSLVKDGVEELSDKEKSSQAKSNNFAKNI